MKILLVDPCQSKLPVEDDLIRADTYISLPLAKELSKKGHSVSFLTTKDSIVDVPQVKTDQDSLFTLVKPEQFYAIKDPYQSAELTKMFFANIFLKCVELAKSEHFDLIHVHSDSFLFELEMLKSIKDTPIVVTIHSIPEAKDIVSNIVQGYNLDNRFFVSISNKQREFWPYSFNSTVYNGIDPNLFKFHEKGGEDMIFTGRVRKIKGIKEAIETAIRTKRKLTFHGKTSSENVFVKDEIEPLIKQYPELISYSGFIKRAQLENFYGEGKLILVPIQWEEPFGLVMIEAMACGTPVIAFAKGSVPEIVKDGVTGFIVNSSDADIRGDWIIKKTGIEGLQEAVERIYAMSSEEYLMMRKNCRKHVEDNFTVEKMAEAYEKVYKEVAGGSR